MTILNFQRNLSEFIRPQNPTIKIIQVILLKNEKTLPKNVQKSKKSILFRFEISTSCWHGLVQSK